MTKLKDKLPDKKPEPFTEDETIVKEIGNTTYIIHAKYKQGATEGLADKILRIIRRGLEDEDLI